MLNREKLHAYQVGAIQYIKDKKKCALFLEMGLGKTATTLTAISDLIADGKVKRVLVIAPLRVANTVWAQEALKWEQTKHLNIKVCTGTIKQRDEAIKGVADVVVINRENIPWLVENYKWGYDMLVVDESSSFKSPKSKRFKALKKQVDHLNYTVLLTGTPAPNGYLDLWSQFYLIDKGERLGRNMTMYKDRYFIKTGYHGYTLEIREGAADTIQRKIEDKSLTMKTEDYLTLPDKILLNETIKIPAGLNKKYKELEKEFVLSLGDTDIEVLTAAAMSNKLLQMCNGAVYDDNGDWHEVHKYKIERLKELLDDNASENILIAYNFKSDLVRLQKALPQAKVLSKSGEEVSAWNRGEIKVLLAHPASAGHGLNLQGGGNTIIWFGLTWSLENYQQFNARLHRQGQGRPVTIHHILMDKGLDQQVMGAINSKATTQEELLNYFRDIYIL